ncbi:3-dehydroquinate synthase [Rubrivirga marina]|uniref:3-dehydroquinate synthase n=1 Tax=Rubrivirga marina TaxID=1196024 RepID=UPI001C527940|nr:3-dehydroquinate synthase [Rubrivirga marina]
MSPPAVHVALSEGRSYAVHFEPLATAPMHLREAGLSGPLALVVTDETVGPLHLGALADALRADGWTVEATAVPAGEGSKSLDQLSALHDWALGLGIDRQTPLLALGGGVVGDLAGFAAATLLRGIPLVHLPTTTISQVDSAIGGKTGINHATGKNLVGAFHQPRLVLADPATLDTLDERAFRSGLAEAVKHALISDPALADRLDREWDTLVARQPDVLAPLLRDAAAVKARVIEADEREAGERAFLNFGHTFGHALEKEAGYGTLTHGEAVALGMRAALHLSESLRLGQVAEALGPFAEADRLVARLDPPAPTLAIDALMAATEADKKRTAAGVRYVVLDAVGRPRLAADVDDALLRAAWRYALSA